MHLGVVRIPSLQFFFFSSCIFLFYFFPILACHFNFYYTLYTIIRSIKLCHLYFAFIIFFLSFFFFFFPLFFFVVI
ncbi:hypothetical protein QBC42DRAFT_260640 [Cladorrhinum samala]|uniref:Uncharacterized protein n=1 Tax=Cladorrhinum samala TaxID=585594 RepID=A0AAV9I059_9PEZI|nr:hypothetical protein QBC42DRAFT_260640 [Cladorrhinum samala]